MTRARLFGAGAMLDLIRKCAIACGIRGPARRARDRLLASLGCPQAYVDLATVAKNRPGVTYIDIGCHHGATVRRFLDLASGVSVVAFDPSDLNLRVARSALSARTAVTFICAAVADKDGRQPFFRNANEQTSSLLPNASGNARSFPQDTKTVGTAEVEVVRLDTWAAAYLPQGPAIVKCDTQGAEAKVVRGAMRFLREQVVAFYAEVMLDAMYEGQASFQELRNLLEGDCGFVLRNIYPCLHDRDGRAVQFDALWVKPDALPAFV